MYYVYMRIFKPLTRRDWTCAIIFCLVMFLAAGSASIKGGVCASSPCSGLNQSFTDDRLEDYFFDAESVPFIAPTAGLSYLYLKNDPAFSFGFNSAPYSFSLDSKDERFQTPDSWRQNDKRVLSKVFFIHEFFVLLSLPLWFGVALALRLLSKRKDSIRHAAGILFWLLIVSAMLLIGLHFASGLLGVGESDETLRILF